MSDHEDVAFPPGYPQQPVQQRVHFKWTPVFASCIGLIALIVVSLGLVRAFELALMNKDQKTISAIEQPGYEKPVGAAQLNPAQVPVKEAYFARQKELLSSYGWVDREKNIVRIPIDRAKSLIVEKYGKEK